jgi:hypothetical protein
VHRFPGGFRNVTCSSHVCLEQPIHSTARGFREIYENFNAFCKRQNKLVKLYQINWTKKSADQCISYKYDLVFKTKTYLDISWDSPFSRLRTHESFCSSATSNEKNRSPFLLHLCVVCLRPLAWADGGCLLYPRGSSVLLRPRPRQAFARTFLTRLLIGSGGDPTQFYPPFLDVTKSYTLPFS